MHSGGCSIGVVIPAFNPCHRLGFVLDGILPPIECVVIVDDGSGSKIEVPSGAVHVPVEIVRHETNRGVGAAIVTGYRRCRELGLDVAVVMGADDQMDPADLKRLVEPIVSGRASYSKGDRLSHPDCARVMPASRLIGNCCLTFLTRIVTGLPVMDSQCGYTAIRLEVLDMLPLGRVYPRYGFPNDMLAALSGAGLQVSDVVVRPKYNGGPSGIRPVTASLVYPFVLARSMITRAMSATAARRAGSSASIGPGS